MCAFAFQDYSIGGNIVYFQQKAYNVWLSVSCFCQCFFGTDSCKWIDVSRISACIILLDIMFGSSGFHKIEGFSEKITFSTLMLKY